MATVLTIEYGGMFFVYYASPHPEDPECDLARKISPHNMLFKTREAARKWFLEEAM